MKRNSQVEDRLEFDLTHHPLLRVFQKVSNEAQILLTPNEEQKTAFGENRKTRTLKDYLVRAKITNKDSKESKSTRCNGKRWLFCQYIEYTCKFEDADGSKCDIRKGVINCNTDFSIYKFHCSSCSKQYVESDITDFRNQFNNYKSAFCKISKSDKPPKINRELFRQDFKLPKHFRMDDWRVTLINRADNRKELRIRESFWQYKINKFFPHGLKERNVPSEYE